MKPISLTILLAFALSFSWQAFGTRTPVKNPNYSPGSGSSSLFDFSYFKDKVDALNGKVPSTPPSTTEPTLDSVNFFTPTKTGNDSDVDPVEPEEKKAFQNRPAPKPKSFPLHWGTPPEVQADDKGPLPGGYGMGSSTLAKWIEANMAADDEAVQSDEKSKEETFEISKDEESDETRESEPLMIEDTTKEEDLTETEGKDDSGDESEEESNDEMSDEDIAEVLKEKDFNETSELVAIVETPIEDESDTAPTKTEYSETTDEENSEAVATGSPQTNENPEQGWAGDGVVDLGASWKESDWFGVYWDSGQGWIYHLSHGWVFPEPSTGQEDGCWIFFPDFGWLYTGCDICPFLYVDSCKHWIYFMQASEELTAFFSFADDTWFHRGEMPPSMIFSESSQ